MAGAASDGGNSGGGTADGGALAIVLASRNAKKLNELDRIAKATALDVQFLSLDLFPDAPTAPEEEPTFAGNARSKALWYARATGQLCLADDSGLEVDALGGNIFIRCCAVVLF